MFVFDFLNPLDHLAVEHFLNGDMRHRRGGRGAVPVVLAGQKPDHLAGPDIFEMAAPVLRATASGGHNKSLPERMGVPCRPRAGLEAHACVSNQRRLRLVE
jgi:hypothetical protein